MPTTPLRERPSWKALEKHHAEIGGRHLRDLKRRPGASGAPARRFDRR